MTQMCVEFGAFAPVEINGRTVTQGRGRAERGRFLGADGWNPTAAGIEGQSSGAISTITPSRSVFQRS